ncbi:hypothetical protein Sjap_014107 [Stephania japonica]|uniref:Symplekin n=1 Tax=Stephania japonica TaxID=461633 RepID=A0AAP0IZZ6_9MAGN
MVGMISASSGEEVSSLFNSFKFAIDVPSKLDCVRRLKEALLKRNSLLLPDFIHRLLELQSDRSSPVRKALAEYEFSISFRNIQFCCFLDSRRMFGEIGLIFMEYVPDTVPVLIAYLKDDTPAVARQAITSGTYLFCGILEKVAIQGLHSTELDEPLKSSWGWMLKFKDTLHSIAFQPGRDGIRLLSVKFVESMVLLYTPDPNTYSEIPSIHTSNVKIEGFNISCVKGSHPVLKLGDLSIEAGQSLNSLLDLLRFPKVKSLSNSMMIVLINSRTCGDYMSFSKDLQELLSAIAKKRPAFYGRILPVLLGLDPPMSVIKGVCFAGVHHVLKISFLSCLKCTHQGAVPWRDRLVGALKEMKVGELAKQADLQDVMLSGSIEERTGEDHFAKEKLSTETFDPVEVDAGRKRSVFQEVDDLAQNGGVSGKRYRSTPTFSIDSNGDNPNLDQGGVSTIGPASSSVEGDGGHVQQLVAMFGALVAQGEKAVGSLEIIISSISTDLLAEVVIANMRHLPSTRPNAEEDDEPIVGIGSVSSAFGGKILALQSSLLGSEVSALSGMFPELASLFRAQPTMTDSTHLEVEYPASNSSIQTRIDDVTEAVVADGVPVHSIENGSISVLSEASVGIQESEIPGLDAVIRSDKITEAFDATQMTSTVLEVANVDLLSSLDKADLPSLSSIPTDKSEELSPSIAVSDSSSTPVPITSVVLSSQYVLPKMSAPVIDLSDDQKDHLQKTAFIRIIEGYKQISVAGGSRVRFSLLAYLAVKYPLELDPWKLLQEHILSDYLNHEGHELTLRVLYRLYGEAEQEHDFFSSTTATSVYETFLLIVAETLRDSFPPSDKSLSRLFSEVPYLPKSAFKLLESLCSPGKIEKADKEIQSGDRVTQGLSAVWSLILLRPSIRDTCLKIALQDRMSLNYLHILVNLRQSGASGDNNSAGSFTDKLVPNCEYTVQSAEKGSKFKPFFMARYSAVHQLEEVRMKAIRLVANKLYPIACITQQIEDFASETLHSILKNQAMERKDANGSMLEVGKNSDLEGPSDLPHTTLMEVSSDNCHALSASSTSSFLVSEAQRFMSLYFALCTKKHSLFHQIFVIYKSIPKAVTEAVHRHIPILVRTIGASPELLVIISDPPTGSESLIMQVLQILTEGTTPSPELVSAVRRLYDSKLKDVEVLIPILSSLPKDEVLSVFPSLVNLPLDKFQVALTHILQGQPHTGPVLTPAEVLIAVNGIDPDRDGIPLKKVTDACNACFEQRNVFTQQVLAKVLNNLVEQTPLPLLFMRTVLQAIGAFPALAEDEFCNINFVLVMHLLSHFVNHAIISSAFKQNRCSQYFLFVAATLLQLCLNNAIHSFLVDFIMEILSRLVTKQIWKYPKLWVGFLKCSQLTKPQSFGVLLQLPAAQLENALSRIPALKAPLIAHASQPNIRPTLPRSTLVVLGIVNDSQISSQPPTLAPQASDASNSAADGTTEKTKESSAAS